MVNIILRVCRLVYETADSFVMWRRLVERHHVQGVAVHDARLAAIVLTSKQGGVLTLNPDDFRRYEADGLAVLTPSLVAP